MLVLCPLGSFSFYLASLEAISSIKSLNLQSVLKKLLVYYFGICSMIQVCALDICVSEDMKGLFQDALSLPHGVHPCLCSSAPASFILLRHQHYTAVGKEKQQHIALHFAKLRSGPDQPLHK